MRSRMPYRIPLIAAMVWCAALVVPPLLSVLLGEDSPAARAGYSLFAPVCHQWDSHSLHLAGYKLGVCARCAAIYFGWFAGVVVWSLGRAINIRRSAVWCIAAAIPMVVDVVMDLTGFHQATLATRLVSGSIFGFIASFSLLPSVVDALNGLFSSHSRTEGTSYVSQTR